MVGSFGAFRRAVHVIRCAGSDGSGVVRTALGRLRLAGLTRRGLQIRNTSGNASVKPAARTVRTLSLSTHMGLALTEVLYFQPLLRVPASQLPIGVLARGTLSTHRPLSEYSTSAL